MVDYQPHVSGSTRLKLTNSAMKQISLLVAPANEQTRIVEKLEELLSDLDAGVAELKAAQKKLVQYRQSLLKAAVEGALTAEWRTANQPKETGTQLLERILIERRARWEVKQLAKFKEQGKAPPKDWQAKYPEPVKPDTNDLPELPEGWIWASLDQVASTVRNGLSQKPSQEPIGYPILRINAVRPMSVNLNEVRYLALAETTVTEYILENGDILATRYNGSVDLLGVFGVVRGLTTQTLHPDKLIRIKPVLDSKLADWIEICAAIGESRRHIVSRVKTTAGQTGISGEDVKKMPIPLAPLLEQEFVIERLTTSIQEISSQGYAVDTSLKQSALQRKNILKAAFSGQLVPQDSNDEPAIFLLERIQAERSVQAASKMPLGRKRKQLA
jgi:type I restriction enzyme S subunit